MISEWQNCYSICFVYSFLCLSHIPTTLTYYYSNSHSLSLFFLLISFIRDIRLFWHEWNASNKLLRRLPTKYRLWFFLFKISAFSYTQRFISLVLTASLNWAHRFLFNQLFITILCQFLLFAFFSKNSFFFSNIYLCSLLLALFLRVNIRKKQKYDEHSIVGAIIIIITRNYIQ